MQIQITIDTYNAPAGTMDARVLAALLDPVPAAVPKASGRKPGPKPKAAPAAAPEEDSPAPEEDDTPAPEPSKAKPAKEGKKRQNDATLDDALALATQLVSEERTSDVKDVLSTMGYKRVSQLSKPEEFNNFVGAF